jgi:hypothetical protein
MSHSEYQKEYARRRAGPPRFVICGPGLLSSLLTLGRGAWLTEEDIDLGAETGTMIATTPAPTCGCAVASLSQR